MQALRHSLFVLSPTVNKIAVKTVNLDKFYGRLQVLNGISIEISKGEIISIVGPSGAGKSTLLQLIGTLDKPDSGCIFIGVSEVGKMNAKQLAAFRNRKIGFIFQFHHLLPEFTAIENVMMPALIAGLNKTDSWQQAKKLLDKLGLSARMEHKPSELSGGEQQRVAVARALINNPEVVLADEPSGNLDTENAKSLHNLFFDLRKNTGQTFIIVTHNEELAEMADRKLEMRDGRIL
ncbi:MAG: ABC transporter ATP-binding protein [Bacteroidia bacterium]|nr:ABC transporter ATP-binding protein [Bacteroidia bacterium]